MQLRQLSLTNYRNFTRLDVDVPTGTVVLVGSNAQGKTSLLEAIYYLATLSSQQAETDRQLINFLTRAEPLAVARIVAEFDRGSSAHRVEIRLIQERNSIDGATRMRKEMLVDGLKQKARDTIGQFNAVLFLPQMMQIIDGSPVHRRRYLDLALAQVRPVYGPTLSAYRKAVTQRNALLKQLGDRGGDSGQLAYWDEQIAGLGARLIYARIHAVKEMEQIARHIHQDLTRKVEVLRIDYRPAYDPLPVKPGQMALPLDAPVDRSGFSVEEIENGFLAGLGKKRSEEIGRGVTTIGPHRDEIRFRANGVDLGLYGSRGQIRTGLLTLKLAEVAWMHERTGHWPVVLLDEVLAELDNERRADLQSRIGEYRQTLMTTTDLNLFEPGFVERASLWRIESGRLLL